MKATACSPTAPTASSDVEGLLEHRDFLQRMVHELLGDSHDSEDVVQQTWLAVLTSAPEPVRKPRTWLARIAKNRSIDLIRRHRTRVAREQAVEQQTTRPAPDEALEIDSIRSCVSDAVSRLAEPYRTSIELRFFEGLPPREVARRMGVPIETARTRIKRALAALRTRLDGDFPGGRHAWMVALLRLRERALPPEPAQPWRPVAIAAGLATLFLLGERSGTPDAHAGAADGAAGEPRVVRLDPGFGPGATDEHPSDRGLGNDGWDTWPPEPAVEVEPVQGLGRSRRSAEGTTWGSLAEPVAAPAAAPRAPQAVAAAPAAQAPAGAGLPARAAFGVAAAIDESSPLDVTVDERIAPGHVWFVDPAGGADFETLGEAAAAARSGDLIALAASPEGYEAVAFEGKGVSILGRGAAPVLVRGLRYAGLAANESVVLRNLRLSPRPGKTALAVERAAGALWVESCTIEAVDADALTVESSSAVVLLQSRASAQRGLTSGASGAHEALAGVRAYASDVSLYDSEVAGARGLGESGSGGHGAVVTYGRLFAMGTTFHGGDGAGDPVRDARALGGDGGVGLWAEGEARTLGCSFAGGRGGEGLFEDGADALDRYGLIEDLCSELRRYRVHEVEGSAGRARLVAEGKPGDVLMSVVSAAPSKGYLILHQGTRLVAPPYDFVVEGVVPPGGTLEKDVLVPTALALGGGFERFYAQGFFFDAAGEAYLAGASSIFVLP